MREENRPKVTTKRVKRIKRERAVLDQLATCKRESQTVEVPNDVVEATTIPFFPNGPNENMKTKTHSFYEVLQGDSDFHKDMKSIAFPGRHN